MIQKPNTGYQSRGITITNNLTEISNTYSVVQEYVDNLMLFRNHKFDIRAYALVTSLRPFIGFYH